MARKVEAYTDIGHRIAELAERQREIGKVLHVTQQTVSKKLRGEAAILLSDLQRLAAHYKVPMTYFFEEEAPSADLAAAWERVKAGPAVLREIIVTLSRLSESAIGRVHELTKFIVQGSKGSKGSKRGGKGSRSSARDALAAEDAGQYRK